MPSPVRLFSALTALALVWGLAFVGIKETLGEVSPVTLTILRFAVADVCLLAVMFLHPAARPRFVRADAARLLIMSACAVPLYHFPLNWGEQRTSASVAALVVATAPVMVAVLSALVLHERGGVTAAAGIALAFAGVGFLALTRPESGETPTKISGFLVALIAPLAWAVYTILAKPVTSRTPAARVSATTIMLGSLMTFPLARARTFHEIGALSARGWAWIALLGVGSSVLGYLLFVWALARLPAARVAVLLYTVPVVGVVAAHFIRGEPLGPAVAISAAMVVGGVALTQRSTRRARVAAGQASSR